MPHILTLSHIFWPEVTYFLLSDPIWSYLRWENCENKKFMAHMRNWWNDRRRRRKKLILRPLQCTRSKIWTFIIIQLQVGPDSSILLYYHEHHILATVPLSATLSAPLSKWSGSRPNWSGASPSVPNLAPFANWLAVAIMPPKLTLSSGTMTGLLTLM